MTLRKICSFVFLLTTICAASSSQLPWKPEREITLQADVERIAEHKTWSRDEQLAITREHASSALEPDILVVDHNALQDFYVFDEIQNSFHNGFRTLMFGASYQSAVALKKRLTEDDVKQNHQGNDNKNHNNQKQIGGDDVDWDAPAVFRYVGSMALSVPIYEMRARRFNEQRCVTKEEDAFKYQFLTCHKKGAREGEEGAKEVPVGPRSMLLVGLGSGTLVKHMKKVAPTLTRVDVIEIDPKVVEIAEKYFGIRNGTDCNITIGDVRDILAPHSNKDPRKRPPSSRSEGGDTRRVDDAESTAATSYAYKSVHPDEDDQALKKYGIGKYDIIIFDCATSANPDTKHPLYPTDAPYQPSISQPLSCFSGSVMEAVAKKHQSNPVISVVAINYLGYLEPRGSKMSQVFHRTVRTLTPYFGHRRHFLYYPTSLRKWSIGRRTLKNLESHVRYAVSGGENKDQIFFPVRPEHTHARNYDNIIMFLTKQFSYDPEYDEVLREVENTIKADPENHRYKKVIANNELMLDLARNRYEVPFRPDDERPLPEHYRKKVRKVPLPEPDVDDTVAGSKLEEAVSEGWARHERERKRRELEMEEKYDDSL